MKHNWVMHYCIEKMERDFGMSDEYAYVGLDAGSGNGVLGKSV